MVEIALCLAIVGFALVAIIGVLPTGLQVQRENNLDTVVNQEGMYFLEAIRSGSQGLDELMRYVDGVRSYSSNRAPLAMMPPALNGRVIIGLLSRPYATNVAKVRAITGSAAEKSVALTNFSFGYLLTTQVIPLTNAFAAPALTDPYVYAEAQVLSSNAYQLVLTLQWPLLPDGPTVGGLPQWRAGDNVKVFRTLVSCELTNPYPFFPALYFFEPSTFVGYR
ncbi:MAG: hypothetical protein KGS61_01765 [Verrucomicrobia bacterium]|nr:hypothetical protein [Verrucomicrobiota bacterium]